ncbi:excinuclease ABC subunit UvrA [Candidatus Dependentiae bacterium]|nr:excinuclease ABC subunit UvrA [Candidatus Dependentiae bacterium]MBU4387535.1 excinuclease ABC subunit UvrA [Candidatus Dependentiae bacterium]MCG2756506.1 excinuclease ABC subunit UvrA [Candidatus Dependentiae bacterium]
MNNEKILIFGAKEHNLKSINVSIPKNKFVVITGPSGSGKSSLALDTIYAEGKRRYVESLSSYARQFLGVSKRPDVESIEGLCPAIAIDQKTVGYNPRSTVGTITEIYDYFRVLFARIGQPHCSECGKAIKAESPEKITKLLLTKFLNQNITIAAPVAVEKKGEFTKDLKKYFDLGFYRFLIDGKIYRFRNLIEIDNIKLHKQYQHSISILVDNLSVVDQEAQRLQEAIEKAFNINNGLCSVITQDNKIEHYSSMRICIDCVKSFPELEPRLFSFNSPIGACKNCHGLGFIQEWPWQEGDDEHWKTKYPDYFGKYAKELKCTFCNGKRLNDEALSVFIDNKNIYDLTLLSIKDGLDFFSKLNLHEDQAEIAAPLLKEIISRLKFLNDVGLSYLTLGRTARTLSGGEGQRIRLATQIGSSLSGVIYILDEPSIGLHQRDNDKLIETLKKLRDQGNTVLVVEHDMDTIQSADYLIDMGPQAGILGGFVTAFGTPKEVSINKNSLTGAYISGIRKINVPKNRREPKDFLKLKNVTANNLKNINVDIPLRVFAAVSGVSGSGKSSLVIHSLASALRNFFTNGWAVNPYIEELTGVENLSNMVMVDQSPIGRTPRSNPATYLGIFDEIRDIFANLPESNARGYKVGRFSFNVKEGRCFECDGDGILKIPMHFLEDVVVICKSCKGQRYNQQTLEIKFKNKNIAQILDMSVLEALEFFKTFPRIYKRLDLLQQVGLDYIKLGQSSTTLSGGEAQRIKLVNELSKRGTNTLYILDEPTTGLHSCDVEKLLLVLNKLVDRGNTVLVIEHNLDVLKSVDYLIDIGPEGGADGGKVVAFGTPEEVVESQNGYTAKYLKDYL